MHHLAVVFEEEAVGDRRRSPSRRRGPTSLRPRSRSIRCSARSFGSARRLSAWAPILGRRRAARAGAGDRPDRHFAVANPDEDLRRRADDLEVLEVEIAQERRRIDPAQRAVEREGGEREGRFEPLRENHLEDVAGPDVFLGSSPPSCELVRGVVFETGGSKSMAVGSARSSRGSGPLQRPGDRVEARQRRLVGGIRGDARPAGAPGVISEISSLHRVEHHHHGGADQDGVRDLEHVRVRLGRRSIWRTMS